jgi:outer membrane lipoprotein-sorting protein
MNLSGVLLAFALQGMGMEPAQEVDKAAKELLAKIEEKYAKAKSIKIKGRVDIAGNEKFIVETEATFKGDKFTLVHRAKRDKEEKTVTMVSDGADLVFTKDGTTKRLDGKGQGTGLVTAFSRVGLVALYLFGEIVDGKDVAVKDLFTASEAKLGKDEKVGDKLCKVLTYTVTMKGDKDVVAVTLWLDGDTLAPVKRTFKSDRDPDTAVETWSEFAFDAEIKDDVFVLPREDKK